MSAAKPAKPSVFDGTDRSRNTVITWIFDVEQYHELTDTPANKQTKFAASYLTGTAKTWYINNYVKKDVIPPLNEFLGAFKKFFSSATETQDVFRSLEKLRQDNRSTTEHITEFKLLAAQLDKSDLEWIRYTFFRGLNRKLAEAVVNDLKKDDDLDVICDKTLQKASVTELIDAIQCEYCSRCLI